MRYLLFLSISRIQWKKQWNVINLSLMHSCSILGKLFDCIEFWFFRDRMEKTVPMISRVVMKMQCYS